MSGCRPRELGAPLASRPRSGPVGQLTTGLSSAGRQCVCVCVCVGRCKLPDARPVRISVVMV